MLKNVCDGFLQVIHANASVVKSVVTVEQKACLT